MNMQEDVLSLKAQINKLLEGHGVYEVAITDHVCALEFKEYGAFDMDEGGHFQVTFADASRVSVSRDDFIRYQIYYSDTALALEKKWADDLDTLRDAQGDLLYGLTHDD